MSLLVRHRFNLLDCSIPPVTVLSVTLIFQVGGNARGLEPKMVRDSYFASEGQSAAAERLGGAAQEKSAPFVERNLESRTLPASVLLAEAIDSRLKSVSRSNTVNIPTLQAEQPADPNDQSAYPSKSTAAKLYFDAMHSVVEIEGKRELKSGSLSPVRSRGTGFVATPDGRVATMLHVVDDVQSLSVRTFDGKRFPARLVASDASSDLAVLKVDSPAMSALKPLELGYSSTLENGSKLSTFSFPGGWHKMYFSPGEFESAGPLKSLQPKYKEMLGDAENGWQQVLYLSTHAEKGSSGAPVVNDMGKVVGIADFANGMSTMLAVPVESLKKLLWK